MAIRDKRRPDQRTSVNSEPFWLTSRTFGPEDFGKEIMLFSFEKSQLVLLAPPVVEIITAFDAAATFDVGSGTIATNSVGEAGAMSVVDADFYCATADHNEGVVGIYPSAGGSAAVTAIGTGQMPLIKGAAATCPTIYVTTANTPTVGAARVHFLVSKIPIAG